MSHLLSGALLLASAACAQGDPAFSFSIPDAKARPGGEVAIDVLAEIPVPVQGFSFTILYPPSDLRVDAVGVEDTIVEAIDADYVQGRAFPELGAFFLAVLVDTAPPFDAELIPAIGMPLAFGRVRGVVTRREEGVIPLAFARDAERPLAKNVFSVDNYSVSPGVLADGRVIVCGSPVLIPAFIRGDGNTDGEIDISDAISILIGCFVDRSSFRCRAASDANDDQRVDLSDAIFLVQYLYNEGPRPSPPQDVPAPDPWGEDGALSCWKPLVWLFPY
jgi:hypothetical protein